MRDDNNSFSHVSLQDTQSIKEILDSIGKSIKKGRLYLKITPCGGSCLVRELNHVTA